MPELSKPILLYGLATAFIMAPLVLPGYIFALDMVFTPNLPLPPGGSPSFVILALLHYAAMLLPSDILQKIVLCALLLLAGLGAHVLARTLLQEKSWSALPLYGAGLLYVFNPFVYARFMSGQYLVLLGYALLPFMIRSVWRFFEKPTAKTAVIMGGWSAAVSLASVHVAGIALLIVALLSWLWLWRRRRDKQWLKATAIWGVAANGIVLIASSYWLVPLLFGVGSTANTIQSFTQADRSAFATHGEGLGVFGNILTLRGFWAEAPDLFLLPENVFWWWWLPLVLVLLLVVYGIYVGWKYSRGLTLAFGAGMLAAAFIAMSTIVNSWLVATIPLFAGFREPQKFVVILALGYAIFGALALRQLQERLKHLKVSADEVIIVLCALPIATAPLMPLGFAGQLRPREYPADWYTANTLLSASDGKVLFLPWHLYMRFDFAGRVVANPAKSFFSAPIVMSGNPEMAGAKSYSMTQSQQFIEKQILPAAGRGENIAGRLQKQGIAYVVVAKELDYKNYNFLSKQPGFTILRDSQTLRIYRVDTTIEKR